MLLRLGELVQNSDGETIVYSPGLHFKYPFIEKVVTINSRLQTFQTPTLSVLTSEQKFVNVDYFVKWKVSDFNNFYLRTSNNTINAENLLEKKVNDSIRTAFGNQTIQSIIAGERANIMARVVERLKDTTNYLGVDIVDVRIKKIDLPDEVNLSVFERMKVERLKVANKYRADGQKKSEQIKAEADKNVVIISATAEEQAANIRAEGEKESAILFNKAYSKNDGFYLLLRSLDAYSKVFSEKDFFVINPEGNKFFNQFVEKENT